MWGRRILRGSEEGFMEHEGKWNSFISLCLSLPWNFLVFTILHIIWQVVDLIFTRAKWIIVILVL